MRMSKQRRALVFWVLLATAAIIVGATSLVFLTDIGAKVVFSIAAVLALGLSISHIRAYGKDGSA